MCVFICFWVPTYLRKTFSCIYVRAYYIAWKMWYLSYFFFFYSSFGTIYEKLLSSKEFVTVRFIVIKFYKPIEMIETIKWQKPTVFDRFYEIKLIFYKTYVLIMVFVCNLDWHSTNISCFCRIFRLFLSSSAAEIQDTWSTSSVSCL